MLAAILTTFCFALSATSGQRIALYLGSLRANFYRLLISCLILGLIVWIAFPESLAPKTFAWFFFSGLIGFGIGDVALYLAYERIGSRRTILLTFCLAPLFAATTEWLWLGHVIPPPQLGAAAIILAGVAMVVWSRPVDNLQRRGQFGFGLICGIIAGFGQGCGAAISRKAHLVELETGVTVNGISEAFQRVVPGLLVAFVAAIIWRKMRPGFHPNLKWDRKTRRTLGFWMFGAALFGPVIGVSFFQLALESMPSGLVLAVISLTPILLIPLAWVFENDRPTIWAILGGIVAVAGVITLQLLETPVTNLLENPAP